MSQLLQSAYPRKGIEPCVLIVDDEPVIRDLCRRSLKGYRVIEAGDGAEGLRLYEQGGIDVILTDYMMPRVNGLDLLQRVKAIEPTFVVIMMTGFAEKDVILSALKADADDFITKPLNIIQLKTAVDKALDRKALKEQIANLKNMDRLKSNFLSLISHKFRTPITSISLFLQNLAKGFYDPQEPACQESARLIYEQSCYLGSLVTDLLNFNKFLGAGEGMNLEPCDLPAIITSLAATSRATANPGIETILQLDPLPLMALDREKVSFAIMQVLDNAYKFSRDSGQVLVSLYRAEDEVHITVTDTGIGIAPNELPKIFEKFYQVDIHQTGQVPGFGLGLFYAREFIRLHNGNIAIESESGQGTKVVIALPIAEICPL